MNDGKMERQLLFVNKVTEAAKFVSSAQEFVLPQSDCKCDLNTLLIVKAIQMKVRVESRLEEGDTMMTQKLTVF